MNPIKSKYILIVENGVVEFVALGLVICGFFLNKDIDPLTLLNN